MNALKRMMSVVGLSMALAVSLAACEGGGPGVYSGLESRVTNRVDYVTHDHDLIFAPGTATPSPEEQHRFERFLAASGVGAGETVSVAVDAGTNPAGARVEDDLHAKRKDWIVRALASRGIGADVSERETKVAPAPARDSWRLAIGHYVVTPPACPDWSQKPGPDFDNKPSSNFGCATAANLGLMVANPGDLLGGRPMGPADGEQAAAAIQRYRTDKVKPLDPAMSSATAGIRY